MKTPVHMWTFESSSGPHKTYETLKYDDGSMSCDCPGWTRRVAADGSRTCKHVRIVESGFTGAALFSAPVGPGRVVTDSAGVHVHLQSTAPTKPKLKQGVFSRKFV